MKKFFTFLLSVSLVVAFFLPHSSASAASAFGESQQEEIKNYTVHVFIQQNGNLHVQENILYNFGVRSSVGLPPQKHGIYRDIPFEYQKGILTKEIEINNIRVTNETGSPYHFELTESNGNKRIKIGDANVLVEGKKEYHIEYDVEGALVLSEEGDIVNWNVIGDQWQVPIYNVSVQVDVAPEISAKKIDIQCFQGGFGSTDVCTPGSSKNPDTSFVFMAEKLDEYQGMTVRTEFEPYTFSRPTAFENFIAALKALWPLGLPLGAFIFLLVKWWKTGRDPKGKGTLIVQFDSPDNLTPLEVGTLIDESPDPKDISAEIISLAQQGYLRIVQQEKSGWFGTAKFTLEKLKNGDNFPNEFDKILLAALFAQGSAQKDGGEVLSVVSLDELKYKFSDHLASLKEQVLSALTTKGYFVQNPQKTRMKYFLIGFGIIFVLFSLGIFLKSLFGGAIFWGSLVVTGFLFVGFAPLMAARTQKGVYAREHILGLKQYLSVAEKDRIQFHNAPEKNPQVFEKFLPYAMVLGVEKEWAAQFADMYKEMQPSWYRSTGNMHFSALYLAQSLGSFSSTSSTLLAAKHSSSGSGGGGGFSGGGFGGGGGGSW